MSLDTDASHLLRHVAQLSHFHPDLWKRVDEVRERRDWPSWCFLPSGEVAKLIARTPERSSRPGANLYIITALSAWRVTQGVYKFDPDLFDCVWNTSLDTRIPCEVLFRLPEWCVYVMTPGCKYEGQDLHGFFAHLDDNTFSDRKELRILLDPGNEDLHLTLPIDLSGGSLQSSLNNTRNMYLGLLKGIAEPAALAEFAALDLDWYAGIIGPLVNLLLYISSANADITNSSGLRPSRRSPKITRKGSRLFPPNRPAEWSVGFQLGAALRATQRLSCEKDERDPGYLRARPRPHFRRAHWHSYWTGPVNTAELRHLELKWMPPIAVNINNGLPSVPAFHRVTDRQGAISGHYEGFPTPLEDRGRTVVSGT